MEGGLLEDDRTSPSDGAVDVIPRISLVKQEGEGRGAVYNAIRTSNVELLRTLLETVAPKLLEVLVSQSYEELLLNNVLVSEEMHMYVQYTLLDQRFFSKSDEDLPDTSSANIQERIQLLVENVAQIKSYEEVDSHFLYTAKFIAQNILILKQQLKSTYDVLPWEEMEFCLVSFVFGHSQRQEMNIFYLSVLTKDKLLKQLDKFTSTLQELKERIGTTNVENLKKSVRKGRETIAAKLSEIYPDIYRDYKEVRDVSSLHIMKTYLDAALLADPATKHGQLTIKRALQVTGEHLKNTLDSPKLSPAVSDLLLLSVPKDTRKVLQVLRNSLCHPHLESQDSVLHSNIQKDLKKIASVISEITYFNKVDKIKRLLTGLVDSDSVEEFQEIENILRSVCIVDVHVQKTDNNTKEYRKIVDLIKNIKDQTPYEKKLFVEIKNILNETKLEYHLTMEEYCALKRIVRHPSDIHDHKTKTVGKIIRETKFKAGNVLENFPSQINPKFENYEVKLDSLLNKFYDSVSMRINPEFAMQIQTEIISRSYVRLIDKENINITDDYSRQLLLNKIKNDELKNAKKSSKIISEQLTLKLTDLDNTIGIDRMSCQLYEHLLSVYKDEINNKFVVEALVLDIMSLLDSSECFPNNMLYLDGDMPLLNGRCLRNYLAHGNALVDVLPTGAWSAVLLKAAKISESKDILLNCKIGNIVKHNIKQLRQKCERGLSILDKQNEMWKSLLDGSFQNFAIAIAGGADICSRKEDLSSTLHYAARGGNIETIKFLAKQQMINTELKDVNGQTALHVAAAFGKNVIVRFLVAEMGNAINQIDGAGKTPLHLASQNGHKETVVILLSLEAKITVEDIEGKSPLHYAVMNNYLDVVKILLEVEVTVEENCAEKLGFTSLHTAAEFGYVEIVQYLLLHDADINARTETGAFPLHLAVLNGHLEITNILLEKGADANLRDFQNFSLLHCAVLSSHEEIVNILLEKGAFVNNGVMRNNNPGDNITPIHLAVFKGNAIIVDLLLQHKANVNAIANDGLTPLLIAAMAGHADIVDLLLQKGALADSRDIEGVTALHFAAAHGHFAVVETLIQSGIDIDTQVTQGTPLHLAAASGHQQVVDILLVAGADVNSANDEGNTALHHSALNGHLSISEALIQKGAKVNCKNSGNNTPLHAAATQTCNVATLQMLLKHGAHVNEKEAHCFTALHIASFIGDSPMVEALLQGKAEVDAKDNDGDTALLAAASGNHKAVVEILLEHQADINQLNNEGSSALCWAAKNNNKELLDMLIKKGANVNVGKPLLFAITAGYRLIVEALLKNENLDINIKDENGPNHLYAAALNADVLIAKALIKRGLNVADSIQDSLRNAIMLGRTRFVDVLLENGANINLAMECAVQMNKPDILEKLLERGGDANIRVPTNRSPSDLEDINNQIPNTSTKSLQTDVNDNRTLLECAVLMCNLEVIRVLVDRGADINAKGGSGYKAIHTAAIMGHHNILAYFLERGMSIHQIDDSNGFTLLHYAAAGGQLAVAQYLIDKQADINSTPFTGLKPIHCAAQPGHTEMVKLLLRAGAVYDATDILGRTPLDFTNNRDIKIILESIGKLFKAVKKNDVVMVETLIKDLTKYLDVKSSDNSTLLHIASWKGFQEVCAILLKSKANPNVVGKGGNSPLHYASQYSHPGIVESLLKSGAVHNLKSDNTKTPLDYAMHEDIKYLLNLVALCFQKVQSRDITVIEDINTIRHKEIIKAVMKARNTDGNTLVVVAMKNDFSHIDKLKQVLQTNVSHILSKVESLFTDKRFTEALYILKQLLNESIEILGENNPGTLDILFKIALVLLKQSNYSEAMRMLEDIYRKRVETFGPHHPDSLETRSMLAVLMHRLGRNKEAWDILQEVIPRQQEALGEGNEKLMQTKSIAGVVLSALGKHEEALGLHTELYKIFKNTLGNLHLDTLTQQTHIAMILLDQRKHHESFALLQNIYEAKKKIIGLNHTETLKARCKMAVVLMRQHKLDEALQIYQNILAIQKNVLGLSHLDTVETQTVMKFLYLLQSNPLNALKLHKAGLDERNAIFDPNDPRFTELDRCLDEYEKQIKSRMDVDLSYVPPCDVNFLKAASEGDRGEVRRLIDNGSDVNSADGEGRTALHFAATVEVAKMLLDSGADPTAVSQKGNTPLHLATSRACRQTVRLFLQNVKKNKPKAYHKFINAKTLVGGSTALHVAAKKGATDIVSILLEHGACYNSRDVNGNTPLQCSCSPSVTQLLRLAEEVFEMAGQGDTVLPQGDERHLAAVVNSRDTEHMTPLQLAQVHGHISTARLLAKLLKH